MARFSNQTHALHFVDLQIPALAADIQTPEYTALGVDEEEGGGVQAVNAWFGPAGTVTPLHTDPHHNLLAQVGHRKTPAEQNGFTPRFIKISSIAATEEH